MILSIIIILLIELVNSQTIRENIKFEQLVYIL